jgi:superfamily II DNA or RNA helicase
MTTLATPRALRTYQTEAVDAVLTQWGSGNNRTAVVLPTGAGKSTVIAKLAARSLSEFGLPVAMIAHRAELLDQMAATVAAVDPCLPPVGIVRAEMDESDAPIIAASLQTLVNPKRLAAIGRRRVVLWDEVHHAGATSWEQVLSDMGGYRDDHFFCGFTATLRRDDGKALRDIIQSVAYEKTIRWAIEKEFLVKPTGLTVRLPNLDLGKVKVTAGDFQNSDLAEVMEAAQPYIVQAIALHARERRAIVFAAGVDAAHSLAAALREIGIPASGVTGDMGYAARQEVYADFRSGRTQMLVTVQVLTEGADFPMCDAVVVARPTRSQNLYSQMIGRALRTFPGKPDALILDLVGASRILSLVTLTDLDTGTVSKKVELDGTEIPPQDDEPLMDSGPAPEKIRREGPVDMVPVDLLSADNTAVLWLATPRGIPFLQPTGGGFFVFLWPDTGTGAPLWKVGRMVTSDAQLRKAQLGFGIGNTPDVVRSGWVDDGRLWTLDVAIAIAEDAVEASGLPVPVRSASWRRNQAPSDAQLKFARTLAIPDADGMTKARLSDEITIALVSRKLDPR